MKTANFESKDNNNNTKNILHRLIKIKKKILSILFAAKNQKKKNKI